MMDIKILFGFTAVIITLFGYIFYFRNLFSGKTKPHAFSWLVWSLLTVTGFSVQFTEHAGPGAWSNGVSGIVCFIVFLIALKKGEKNIVFWDWVSLGAALFAFSLWYLTGNPFFTILLITAIDTCGFFPTVRKSYQKPHQETAILYFTSGLGSIFSLLAMESYVFANYFYPSALVFLNWSFVLMLLWRRKKLKKN